MAVFGFHTMTQMPRSGKGPSPLRFEGSQCAVASNDASIPAECAEILSPEAIHFIAELHRTLDRRRRELLELRRRRQTLIANARMPRFLPETETIRKDDWRVAAIPAELRDRRVEITGPVDRKMIINGLNSGANVFMADFEDSNAPTWINNIAGQLNLRDAVRGDIRFSNTEGKEYKLDTKLAVLFVRPRQSGCGRPENG